MTVQKFFFHDLKMAVHFKLVLLGGPGVGKTGLAVRYYHNYWVENAAPTIGAAFQSRTIMKNDEIVHVSLWDTAGAERFRSVTPMYVRGADAIIICYDLSAPASILDALDAVHMVERQVGHPLVFVVGCKRDIVYQPFLKSKKLESTVFDNTIRFVSAKKNQGIQELFNTIIDALWAREDVVVPKEKPLMLVSPDSPYPNDRCLPHCAV